MADRVAQRQAAEPVSVAHCSWGWRPDKRWIALASRAGGRWTVSAPEPLTAPEGLVDRLRQLASGSGPVLLALDFPIGLPSSYGALTGLADFRSALKAFGKGEWSNWFTVCNDVEQISVHRPFYPWVPKGHRLDNLHAGLGLPSSAHLLRRCDRGTGGRRPGCGLFWTAGPNQVGKAALSGWQDLLIPNLGDVGLWPFDGGLETLCARREIVLAESFPCLLYRLIGLTPRYAWSRKTQAGRAAVAGALLKWFHQKSVVTSSETLEAVLAGFSSRPCGEAQFDALAGLLGILEILHGPIDEGCLADPNVRQWEGWIFGQRST